jgi:enoyl-CoA hydratase/carnithine racemase
MADLVFEQIDHVGVIRLNRPDSFNAFSYEMIQLWIKALREIRDNEDIHVGVLTGNGRAFCAGGDIKAMSRGEGFIAKTRGEKEDFITNPINVKNSLWKNIQRIPLLMEEIDKPMIAAINGAAIGAGLDMALMCDIRFCSEKAKLGEGYVHAGIVPGDGGCYYLPRIIGLDKALDMFWTGKIVRGNEAKELGLVSFVTEGDKLLDEVFLYSHKLANGPQEVLRMTKRLVYESQTMTLKQSLDMVSSKMAIAVSLPDYSQSIKSLLNPK